MGKVIDIVYSNRKGPREKGALPEYVVVDFPDVVFPEGEEWDKDHPTYVPVPVVTHRCEKNCCSCTTIPLRVCKAITTYKSQGMTVGEGQVWEKLVIMLGSSKNSNSPGLEQVAFSRSKELEDFAMISSEENPLTLERLMRIGKSPAYKKRRDFEERLKVLQEENSKEIMEMISKYDTNTESPSFEGGYDALVKWYRKTVTDREVMRELIELS